MPLSESFWIFLLTTSAGLVLACMKVMYDSKCSDINLGCIKIHRDTAAEVQAENNRLEHGINSNIPEVQQPRENRMSVDRPNS
jgi:hypothetical protein